MENEWHPPIDDLVREVRYPTWWRWCYWWRVPRTANQEIAHGSGTIYGGCGSWKLAHTKNGFPSAAALSICATVRSPVQVV